MSGSIRSVGNVDLSIGLVTCPVKMVGVVNNHDRKGSMYHRHDADGDKPESYGKVKMPKLCEDCGEVVPAADISKGFEENGAVVMLTPDEMATVAANTGGAIEIPHFVQSGQVNPMLFADQNIYRLMPDTKRGRQAVTTYRMIRQILTDEKLVGVVQYTRWGRNRIGLLDVEPSEDGGVLIIRNMMWPDELRTTEGILPDKSDAPLDERLLPVMKSVVEAMTADWNPVEYVDAYTVALNEAIEAKAQGAEIAVVESGGSDSIDDVSDLLAKLEATAAAKAPTKKAPAKKAPARKKVA